jgi:predicted nucleotidyltransferase
MEILERLRQQVGNRPELKLAVAFGSTARGEARPDSDVDLGILLEPYSPSLRLTTEAELGRAANRPVHVILLDEAPPLLRFEIARDGVLLHEKEEGTLASVQGESHDGLVGLGSHRPQDQCRDHPAAEKKGRRWPILTCARLPKRASDEAFITPQEISSCDT